MQDLQPQVLCIRESKAQVLYIERHKNTLRHELILCMLIACIINYRQW